MKSVFTNSEICHVFNEQNQSNGRTSNSNIYFEYNKIYSYGSHYLLAKFIDNNTIVINDKGYSNTTSKHISLIINATRDKKQFFKTKIDTQIVLNNINNYLKKFTNARKTKDFYLNEINSTFKMYFEYIAYTNKKTFYKSKDYSYNKEHKQLIKLYNQFTNEFDNLQEQIKEANIKAAAAAKKAIKEKLNDWRIGKINWFRNNTKKDYLRLKGDFIETSQNIKISISEAKRLLSLIENKNIVGQRVDERFVVRSFDNLLKVGCHNIDINEIKYIKNLIQ